MVGVLIGIIGAGILIVGAFIGEMTEMPNKNLFTTTTTTTTNTAPTTTANATMSSCSTIAITYYTLGLSHLLLLLINHITN